MSTPPRPLPERPDEAPSPAPSGPRTPYPVNDLRRFWQARIRAGLHSDSVATGHRSGDSTLLRSAFTRHAIFDAVCAAGVSLFLHQPAMIGADTALNWGHRRFRSRLHAFASRQCDRTRGLGLSQSFNLLSHHSRDLGVTLGPSSCNLHESQSDDALDFETKSHRVEPWFPEEDHRSPWVSPTGSSARSPLRTCQAAALHRQRRRLRNHL